METDSNEKIVGILGLCPYATCDFYRKILDATPAKKDWEHIRILIDNNPKIPSRGRCLELGEADPTPFMREAIRKLKDYGADFVIIPCNTAHYFFEGVVTNLGVPVLNMVEETSKYVLCKQTGLTAIGLVASRITTESKLFDRYFNPEGVKVMSLPKEQSHISEIIEEVKTGNDSNSTRAEIKEIAKKLIINGAEAVIVGCTELSLLLRDGDLSVPIYDSNTILAEIAVSKAKNINT